jgi:hypothetical protein
MSTLTIGSKGSLVRSLQLWLCNFEVILVDGEYGPTTARVVKKAQATALERGLSIGAKQPDGKVGPSTFGAFLQMGWGPPKFEPTVYPVPPEDLTPLTQADKNRIFGRPGTAPEKPVPGGPIELDATFRKSIVSVEVKQLRGVEGAANGKVFWHALVAAQLISFFQEIEEAGFRDRILSCAGTWVPRFVRGSVSSFSSHAYGTAIDLNAPQNWLGAVPARPSDKGCLYELVGIAAKHGFYWGGWFSRKDGMHFEIAKVL